MQCLLHQMQLLQDTDDFNPATTRADTALPVKNAAEGSAQPKQVYPAVIPAVMPIS